MSKRRADSRSENRSNSPRESGPGRHGRDRIELPPLQPSREHQPGHQLPSIGTLDLPTDAPSRHVLRGGQQGAGSIGPPAGPSGLPRRQPEPNRHEVLRQETQEPTRKHQRSHQLPSTGNLESATRTPPPSLPGNLLHEQRQGAGSSGPPRRQLKPKRYEVPRAREQQYRWPFESREAAQQIMSGRAAPATHHSADNDVPSGSAGIDMMYERDLFGPDLDKILKIKKENHHASYKTLAEKADGPYNEREIGSYFRQQARMKTRALKEERK